MDLNSSRGESGFAWMQSRAVSIIMWTAMSYGELRLPVPISGRPIEHAPSSEALSKHFKQISEN